MNRNFWEKLEEWKNDQQKKPLLVIGARQIGKTYIIDKFCKEKYKNYININLFKDDSLINIFKTYSDFDKRVEFLKEKYQIDFLDPDTVLFVDEVQQSEEFIESLKLFCEEGMTNIICAGSLLGVTLKRFKHSFPVGKIHEEFMYPMTFDEFLIAIGKGSYIDIIKKSFLNNEECVLHNELMELFTRYLYLGGMPEVIKNYIDVGEDLSRINDNLLNDIINAYMEDIAKYNEDYNEIIRIKSIYNNIAPQLIKENPKFMYAKFDKKNRKSDYVTALDWLTSSRLVLSCNSLNNIEYPIKLYADYDNYKLFLSDVGILRRLIGINVSDLFLKGDFKYKGVLTENYVACELAYQFKDLFYWTRKGNENNSKAEVDFVIQIGTEIIPLEVKAGTNSQSKSLNEYDKEYNPNLMIKISANNFGQNNNLKSIPLYAVFLIKELTNKF